MIRYQIPDDREARLPKWARDMIANMRYEIERQHIRANETRLDTAPSESAVVLDAYGEIPIGLGDPNVRFKLGGHPLRDYIDVRVGHDYDAGQLLVHGGGTFVIEPHSSNFVKIKVVR